MKKSIITLSAAAVLASTVSSSAFAEGNTSSFHNGAYIGANVGLSYKHMSGHEKESFDFGGLLTGKASRSPHHYSPMGEILGGYRHFFNNNFMLGGELAASLDPKALRSKRKALTAVTSSSASLKQKFALTPQVVVGRTFAQKWMAFAKLGMAIARYDVKVKNFDPTGAVNFSNSHAHKTLLGFAPSIGVEYALNQKVSLNGTLSYVHFGKLSKNLKGNVISAPTTDLTHKIRVRPSTLTAKVGVTYNF